MRFWIREIAGWSLMGVGLFVFYGVYEMALTGHYFECLPWLILAIVVFRGGIQLLRVALAVRACQEAQLPISERPRAAGAAARPAIPGRNAPLGQT